MVLKGFRKEFKNQMIVAISAAFAFLIALSWREPISELVRAIVERFNLAGSLIYYQFASAIVVTLLAVFAFMFLAKWNSKPEEKK